MTSHQPLPPYTLLPPSKLPPSPFPSPSFTPPRCLMWGERITPLVNHSTFKIQGFAGGRHSHGRNNPPEKAPYVLRLSSKPTFPLSIPGQITYLPKSSFLICKMDIAKGLCLQELLKGSTMNRSHLLPGPWLAFNKCQMLSLSCLLSSKSCSK